MSTEPQKKVKVPMLKEPKGDAWACPLCSFVPILSTMTLEWLRAPQFSNGARSGKLFFSGPCEHAPVQGPFDEKEAEAKLEAWNAWAARHAEARVNVLTSDPAAKARWLQRVSRPLKHRLSTP